MFKKWPFFIVFIVLLFGILLSVLYPRQAQAGDTLTAGLRAQKSFTEKSTALPQPARTVPQFLPPLPEGVAPFAPQRITQSGTTLTLTWAYADTERLSIEYTIDGLPVPEKYRWNCPVLETRLYDSNGNLLSGQDGEDVYCLQDGRHIVQTFQPLPFLDSPGQVSFTVEIFVGGIFYPDGRFVDAPQYPFTLEKSGPFRFDVQFPQQYGLTFPKMQSVQVNGSTVQIGDVEGYASLTVATVCADLPDPGDWLPVAELGVGRETIASDGLTLLDADIPATYRSLHRCFRVTFPRGLDFHTPFTIVVTHLARSAPELPTPQSCTKAQERLQKIHPEVAFECLTDGQGVGIHITRKPDSMDEARAVTLAWDAFRESLVGPWKTSWGIP